MRESKKDTKSDIIYGGGYTSDTAKGFIKLAKERGFKNTVFKGIEKKER